MAWYQEEDQQLPNAVVTLFPDGDLAEWPFHSNLIGPFHFQQWDMFCKIVFTSEMDIFTHLYANKKEKWVKQKIIHQAYCIAKCNRLTVLQKNIRTKGNIVYWGPSLGLKWTEPKSVWYHLTAKVWFSLKNCRK